MQEITISKIQDFAGWLESEGWAAYTELQDSPESNYHAQHLAAKSLNYSVILNKFRRIFENELQEEL